MNITMTPVNNFYTFVRTMMLNAPAINYNTSSSSGSYHTVPLAIGSWISTTNTSLSSIQNDSWSQLGGTTFYGFGGLNVWSSGNGRGYGQTYIAIGSNNEATDIADVSLKNEIDTSKYQATLHMENAAIINGKGVLPITITIKAKEPISIGEISVEKAFSYNSNSYQFMFARGTISDENGDPITLATNETKTFQIDIEF